MTQIFKSLSDEKFISLITAGAVGVLPTDTVYGLVCVASDEESVKRLYILKNRENKPGTVIAANIDQLVKLGIKYRYLKAAADYWPDAISVVVPTGMSSNTGGTQPKYNKIFTAVKKISYLDLNVGSLAVRVIKPANLRLLLEQVGPLLTSSANLLGGPPANSLKEAREYFGEKVDFYVDGGDLSGRPPSTIIRIVDDAVEVLREGAIKIPD